MRVGSNFGTRGSVNCRHIVGCREVGILVEGALGCPGLRPGLELVSC